jgi:L-ascorbate metabolism protein UlaG (beta-lactamase superfamily)
VPTVASPSPPRPWPKHFKDRLSHPLPSRRAIWRILREGGFQNKEARKVAHLVPRAADNALPALKPGQLSVAWVGHATNVVRLGGRTILTDPVWSPGLPGRSRRMTEPGLPLDAVGKVDAVVISHDHYDHLDAPTVRRLPRATPIFCGANTARWFRKRGFTDVTELDWWESATRDGVTYTFVPAHHWCRRGLRDVCRRLWGSWVMSAPGPGGKGRRSVYFSGDTGYGTNFKEIGRRFPGLDVAILPIGAYDPRWFMTPVHTNPEEAVQAFKDLGAKRMSTIHWGTFVLTKEPFLEPPQRTREAWAKAGLPEKDLWLLALGESKVFG